jgi:hypothetical protein
LHYQQVVAVAQDYCQLALELELELAQGQQRAVGL